MLLTVNHRNSATSNTPSKKRKNSAVNSVSNSVDNSVVTMHYWPRQTTTNTTWLVDSSSTLTEGLIISSTFDVTSTINTTVNHLDNSDSNSNSVEIVGISTNNSSNVIVIITKNKLIKITTNGELLSISMLNTVPSCWHSVGNSSSNSSNSYQLWLSSTNTNIVSCWDVKYGIQLQTVTVSALNSNPLTEWISVSHNNSSSNSASNSNSYSNSQVLLYSLLKLGNSNKLSYLLYTTTITTESTNNDGSLANLIGRLPTTTNSNSNNGTITMNSVPNSTENSVDNSNNTTTKVLSSLPGPMKRKLALLQKKYDNYVVEESNSDTIVKPVLGKYTGMYKRQKQFQDPSISSGITQVCFVLLFCL